MEVARLLIKPVEPLFCRNPERTPAVFLHTIYGIATQRITVIRPVHKPAKLVGFCVELYQPGPAKNKPEPIMPVRIKRVEGIVAEGPPKKRLTRQGGKRFADRIEPG